MVRVSVLMPVYRTNEEYLREAISSILAQTYSDFEFLILDDCPEDDRELIVKSYKDRRIKYLRNETNMGISESRNKLVDMARGEYLAVMDHDDVSLPERLEKQVNYSGCLLLWIICRCLDDPKALKICKRIIKFAPEIILRRFGRGGKRFWTERKMWWPQRTLRLFCLV